MDQCFGDGTSSASAVAQAIIGAREFRTAAERAVQKAAAAYQQREQDFATNPDRMAPSAQQAARVKFIEVIADELSK
jgi:hypothetical protein